MEDHINEVVSDAEVATNNQDTNVLYYRPKFTHRIFANLVDILIFIFVFVSCFLGVREIIRHTPGYQAKQQELTQMRVDSGLYAYDDDNVLRDIISVLNYSKGQTAKSHMTRSKAAIEKFIKYIGDLSEDEKYVDYKTELVKNLNVVVEDYRNYRLSESMVHNDTPMFIVNESNEVVENPALFESVESISSQIYTVYYEKTYKPFIDDHCQAYIVVVVPHYKDIINYQTNLLLWVNIFAVYCFTGLLVYLVPLFIFRRGRMTIGKALYGIGLVDSNCLSPSLPRTLARFAIFYFAILVLSLFTFGLPIIISFSIMVFSKNKQGFQDYMLRLTEVDGKRTKIYFSFQEVELEKTTPYKKPVDFKTRNYD